MPTNLTAPIDVQIELTQGCNWRCHHCYNYWRPSGIPAGQPKKLTVGEITHVVSELVANHVPSITITGGEPFTQKSALYNLLNTTKKAGISASINTNLSLLDQTDIEKLSGEYGKVAILFSLLSADATEHETLAGALPGSHKQVIRNAITAKQHGLSISLNMVLMKTNLHSLESTAHLAKKIGVRTFCATKALPNTNIPDVNLLLSIDEMHHALTRLMDLERQLDLPIDVLGCYPRCMFADTETYKRFSRRTCVAGFTTATIGADGEVRACPHANTSYGNIFTNSLSSIWQKMNGWRIGSHIPLKCRECPVLNSCRGGCRMNSLSSDVSGMDMYARPDQLIKPQTSALGRREDVPMTTRNVSVNTDLGLRLEEFGALVYTTNPMTIMLVNKRAATFLQSKKENGEMFSFHTFLNQSGTKTQDETSAVLQMFNKLIRKGFLTEKERG